MGIKIVVLPDGSWETFGDVMVITNDAFAKLQDGEIAIADLKRKDILSQKEV